MNCHDALAALAAGEPIDLQKSDAVLADFAQVSCELKSAVRHLQGSHVYLSALGRGLEVLLCDYSDALVALEEEVACDHGLALYYIRYKLSDFCVIFPEVLRIVQAADTRPTGIWLNLLYRSTLDGDPVVALAMARLLHAVNQPLLAHVTHWMAYGELVDHDSGGIFFVRAAELPTPVILESVGGGGLNSIDGARIRAQVQLAEAEHEWTDGHSTDLQAVPSEYIPMHVAQTVLAIGKAVRMLRMQDADWLAAEPRIAPPHDVLSEAPAVWNDDGSVVGSGKDEDEIAERFSSSDSVHIARVLCAVRRAPIFSPLAFECVVDRIRALVYRRLWNLLLVDSDLGASMNGLRRHLLQGRGDLYQAFLERIAPLRRGLLLQPLAAAGIAVFASPAPISSAQICAGPLAAAAVATGVSLDSSCAPLQVSAVSEGVNHDAFFAQCLLTSGRRSVSWTRAPVIAPSAARSAPGSSSVDATNVSSLTSAPVNSASRDSCVQALVRLWHSSRVLNHDVDVRWPRAHIPLVAVGSSALVTTQPFLTASTGTPGSTDANAVGKVGGGASLCLMSRPSASPLFLSGSGRNVVGSLWLSDALPVQQGFVLRCAVNLITPAFDRVSDRSTSGGGRGASSSSLLSPSQISRSPPRASSNPYENTASFAIVVQRHGCLATGTPAPVAAAGVAPSAPAAGYAGIPGSLVIHFLCKRLESTADERAGRAGLSLDSSASRHKPLPGKDDSHPRPSNWRIVVAIYGPAPTSGGTSSDPTAPTHELLASGALMSHSLLFSGGKAIVVPAIDSTVQQEVLHLSIEYGTVVAASSAAPTVAASSRGRGASSTKRLVVTALDAVAALEEGKVDLMDTSTTRGGGSSGAAASAFPTDLAPFTRTLVDVPLAMEDVLGFGGWHGPGRGRAWVGFTAEATELPLVSLEAVDVVCHTPREDGIDSLRLQYAVPWPLHVLLSSGTLALYNDVFSLMLRCRARSLALQDCWKALMATSGNGGRQSRPASSAPVGVSDGAGIPAQISGARGKRESVAARRSRTAAASQQLIRPVWLLRARIAFVLETWLRYLQVDVVEPAHAAYHSGVSTARDFPSLLAAHDALVRSLLAGSFLHSHMLMSTLDNLLDGADELASLVTEYADAGAITDLLRPRAGRERFERVAASLIAGTRMLATALQSAAPAAAAHTLLSRLNYNGAMLPALSATSKADGLVP